MFHSIENDGQLINNQFCADQPTIGTFMAQIIFSTISVALRVAWDRHIFHQRGREIYKN